MNKFYNLFKRTVLFCFVSLRCTMIFAQTNPAAQSLPYSQNFSTLAASSTIYPVGWQGWNLATASSTSFITTAPISDFALTPSSTAATTTDGIHNYNGAVGFLIAGSGTTGTSDPAICLAINTTGFNNVSMSYSVMTIRNPFVAGTNTRINQVDLQYRIGTSGSFTSVGVAAVLYQNTITTNQTGAVTTPQNSVSKSLTLPAACNNQSVVQLRWVQRDLSGIGLRPSFAVDNIVVCTAPVTPAITISGPSAFCTGNTAVYTSTITNGGTTPAYQWKKNGVVVGTNSFDTISGLVIGDQITCVLTSNASCISTLTATSNTITIGTVHASPTINSAIITNVSCQGARNGAINISVSGGTPPYSICWDTVNTSNGVVFGVTVAPKTSTGPLFGLGNANAFYIDGIESKELFLTRGISYSFNILSTAAHPFHISTDSTGGNANNIVTNGQLGAPSFLGTVLFTPNNTHPALLYYPCTIHQYMGYRINIQNGYCVEDLSNMPAGIYSVIVKDANGCTASAQYTVAAQPSSVTLSASVIDATCNASDGSIDLSVSGGAPPYTICWDTANTINGNIFAVTVGLKTPSNPYFVLGNPSAFFINGNEAPDLYLTRGTNYTFNIFNPGHPWHISTDSIGASTAGLVTSGQSGAPIDVGTVTFTPNNSHPSLLRYVCANHPYMGYNIHLVNPYCIEDPVNLRSGIYTVTAVDANGCSASASYTVNQTTSNIMVNLGSASDASCYGMSDGIINLNPNGGTSPYTSSGTGPTFTVIVENKNHSNPQYNVGLTDGFTINGIQGKELTLIRGITYSFSVLAPGHAFYISTSDTGGFTNTAEVTDGVVNSMTSIGTLFFTPNDNHPNLLYYQCAFHDNMGWKIHIVDQLTDGNLGNCEAGDYSLNVSDANGCNSTIPVNVTISEPAPDIFYYDGDLDNYGSNSESAIACTAPPGFLSVSGDCDDADSTIHPGAAEICNGIDDDCNGLVDADDPGLTGADWYLDSDNDGFGNPSQLLKSCFQPSGYVANNLDCNDSNQFVNPGATEICNGIDDNCNGQTDEGCGSNFVTLNLKMFIEGYYVGGGLMDNFGGGGCLFVTDNSVSSTDADTVFVSAMDSATYTQVDRKFGILKTNGNVSVIFGSSVHAGTHYFIRVQHRNAIETWSSDAVMMSAVTSYNFTSGQSQAYGMNMTDVGTPLSEPATWAFFSGDISDAGLGPGYQDGVVESQDYGDMENAVNMIKTGYVFEDVTGDGIVESSDYSLIENNVNFIVSSIHP